MENVRIAFDIMDLVAPTPVGYTKIPLQKIFDLKIDFTRKAQVVGCGHIINTPTELAYSSVIARDSNNICFGLLHFVTLKYM